MHNYDFHERFSDWKEFEKFACQMMERREGKTLLTTAEGGDGGLDFYDDDHINFGQVKNYLNNWKQLWQELKKTCKELDKRKVKRYILVTSHNYSNSERKKIETLFEGLLKPSDLIGRTELNHLLDDQKKYGDIEFNCMNLSIPSSSILFHKMEDMVNHDIYNNSENEWHKVIENGEVYAKGEQYKFAYQELKKNHLLVISGEPGIGKTALAHALIATLMNQEPDYHFF